jgi:hypothetical protein
MMKEKYKTKVTKKKAMDVSVAVSLELQHIQANLSGFTGHNMDFRKETDWARFLMRYIDMEGILLIDPAWPAPTNCNYKSMTLKQIESMPIQHIFKRGIIYLWVIESLINKGCELMKKWGYDYKA